MGLDGDDVIYGNDGNDIIDGGPGADRLYGGAGDDTIKSWRYEGPDYIDGGNGIDLLALKRSYVYIVETIDISTAEKIATPQDLGDGTIIVNMERLNITGGYMGDHFVGGILDDEIYGWQGDDLLEGNAGDDYIDGGAGHDVVMGGSGRNTLIGYGGNDKIVSAPGAVDKIDGGTGADYLVLDRRTSSSNLVIDMSLSTDTVQTLADASTVTGVEQIEFYGGRGADLVVGGIYDDIFSGGDGNDTFNGSAGTDTATYFGVFSNYTINRDVGTVASSADGTDMLRNVEKLNFANGTYDWATGIFKPFFNTPPSLTAVTPTNDLVEAGRNWAGTNTASLQLIALDADPNDTALFVTDGWSDLGGGQWSRFGTYGTATLNASTGLVSYLLDNELRATQVLAEGAQSSDGFTLSVRDNNGAISTQLIAFNVSGSDDASVLTASAGSVHVGSTVAVGLVGLTDFDGGSSIVAQTNVGGDFGSFSIDADGDWNYRLETIMSWLGASQTVLERFGVSATDGTGSTVTVTLNGVNDAPVLTVGSPSNGLMETGRNGPGVDTASLQLTISDPDRSDTVSYVTDGWTDLGGGEWSRIGIYGTAVLNTSTGSVHYVLDNERPATQALSEGAQAEDSFGLTVTDSYERDTATISFSIVGSDDVTLGVTVTGTAGNDVISLRMTSAGQPLATAYDDTIYGLDGNDYIDGGAGADRMIGGSGTDSYTFENIDDRAIEEENGGTDTIQTTVNVDLRDNAFVENLRIMEAAGSINGVGNNLTNLITGNGSSNVIVGGGGNDSLYGKGGADTFHFNEMGTTNRDSIWDFDADDRISLGSVFSGLDRNHDGVVDGGALIIATKFGAKATANHAQLIYNSTTGYVSYDADGAGSQAAQDVVFIGTSKSFFAQNDILL